MNNDKPSAIILNASANRGVGLFTSICKGFANIFGVPSRRYQNKIDSTLNEIKMNLLSQMDLHPDYVFSDYRIVHNGGISFTGSVIGTYKNLSMSQQVEKVEIKENTKPVKETVETKASKLKVKKEDIGTLDKDNLMITGKDYVDPVPPSGKAMYWNNHARGEVVTLDFDVSGIPGGTEGRVLGATKDMLIDVQFEINGEIKVISVYNNAITVKKTK